MKIAIIGATGRFGSAVAHEATAQDQPEAPAILRAMQTPVEWSYVSPPPVHLLESGSFARARFTVGY